MDKLPTIEKAKMERKRVKPLYKYSKFISDGALNYVHSFEVVLPIPKTNGVSLHVQDIEMFRAITSGKLEQPLLPFPSFWQLTDPIAEKRRLFNRYPFINPIFDFIVIGKVLRAAGVNTSLRMRVGRHPELSSGWLLPTHLIWQHCSAPECKTQLRNIRKGPTSTAPSQISRLAFRAPPFWPNNVELWISQLEAAFGLAEISRDETKFQATVTSLDQPTLTYVADIVTAPPPSGKYDALKAGLLQRLGQSKQTKILQVLDGRPMGDQKPSTVLAAMQHQAGRNFSDTALKMLWTRRLPQDIRAARSIL
ncbi:hypothetical protein LAZ67_15000228 [Cordylochernes scorpioides]|uniref:DUF7041 domain-containing protein n=1 Tax=Cordylochernes scorpioides TaxID=51811 RepID=A0ABY6LBE4_9ARAC|nr:hypothetical protein LAZ67_15000228 [Cordylochernes scorpioides]